MDDITNPIKQGSNSPLEENLRGIKWPGDGYMAPGKEALQTKGWLAIAKLKPLSLFMSLF